MLVNRGFSIARVDHRRFMRSKIVKRSELHSSVLRVSFFVTRSCKLQGKWLRPNIARWGRLKIEQGPPKLMANF